MKLVTINSFLFLFILKETNEKITTGDVDFIEASKIAGFITPVPDGVEPMTISMLLSNTFESALKNILLKIQNLTLNIIKNKNKFTAHISIKFETMRR